MLYRISRKNFLVYAIDFFTHEELIAMRYFIISAKIQNGGQCGTVMRKNDLYPTIETVEAYSTSKNISILEKMYEDYFALDGKQSAEAEYGSSCESLFHIIKPVLDKTPIVLVYDDETDEADYVTALCNVIKKHYHLDAINLDQLFKEGSVGPYRIDYNEIHDSIVPLARNLAKQAYRDKASSREGRIAIIEKMTKKQKLRWLKKFDVDIKESDMPNINEILLEAWDTNDPLIAMD